VRCMLAAQVKGQGRRGICIYGMHVEDAGSVRGTCVYKWMPERVSPSWSLRTYFRSFVGVCEPLLPRLGKLQIGMSDVCRRSLLSPRPRKSAS